MPLLKPMIQGPPLVRVARISAWSHPGWVRAKNEDSFALDEEAGIGIVADGMGGHAAGEVASRIACEQMLAGLEQLRGELTGAPFLSEPSNLTGSGTLRARLNQAVQQANRAILERANREPRLSGMGTTLDAALVLDRAAWIAHVGDSRVYLISSGRAKQLTEDHNLAGELENAGVPHEEALGFSNVLTRALGQEAQVSPDLHRVELGPADILVLCSDGVTRYFPDPEEIAFLVSEKGEAAARALVLKSLERGGEDNCTALVMRVAV